MSIKKLSLTRYEVLRCIMYDQENPFLRILYLKIFIASIIDKSKQVLVQLQKAV